MRAILSVYDKSGLVEFAKGLNAFELFSTGGTEKTLLEAKVPVKNISELTGFPEILDGRVKTLHPNVHGGLLANRSLHQHMKTIADHGIEPIDIVVVNLYPFVETVLNKNTTLEDALENIDIGGPTLIRAAAKNFPSVTVIVDPNDYELVSDRLRNNSLSLADRQQLAFKAFQHVALYDTAISTYLRGKKDPLTKELTIGLNRIQSLRYGENPHQESAFYQEILGGEGTIASAKQLHGKELSHNNILDADAAWTVVQDYSEPTVAIVKHTNPCGLASHTDLPKAYSLALQGDPVSAFGGIVAINRTVDLRTAEEIRKTFYEIIIAPSFQIEALDLLKKKKDLRILEIPAAKEDQQRLDYRRVTGGMLVQTADEIKEDPNSWISVTDRKPTADELADLTFAWKTVKHIKSNAIVITKNKALLGMGAGQPNRVNSVQLALQSAADQIHDGAVLASDAFFPFADGVELAAAGGVTAIAQPGGSIRDNEIVAAANKAGLTMVFTGIRHFKH